MQKQPTISVIIPNYNNAQFLTECVDSVFVQTYQPLECIVVDDGSTDNSLEVLNELSQKYPKLRIFEQINSGPSVARNLGMKHAKGEYIAMLDADDYWSERKLENQLKAINEINFEKHIITSHHDYLHSSGKVSDLNNYKLPPYSVSDAFSKNVAIGSCSSVLFPKSMLDVIGGYNPILRGSEDQEFHFRAILHGYQFLHSFETDLHIRYHSNNTTKSIIRNVYFHLIAMEMQIEELKQKQYHINNSNEYHKALIGRLGTISYWAKEAQRKDILKLIKFISIENMGKKQYYKNKIYSSLSNIKSRLFSKIQSHHQ